MKFSNFKSEYAKYSDSSFETNNPLEKQYKEECLKLKERNYQPGRIFTYIDSDPYQFHDEVNRKKSKLFKLIMVQSFNYIRLKLKLAKCLNQFYHHIYRNQSQILDKDDL